jgi:hypothetical protein
VFIDTTWLRNHNCTRTVSIVTTRQLPSEQGKRKGSLLPSPPSCIWPARVSLVLLFTFAATTRTLRIVKYRLNGQGQHSVTTLLASYLLNNSNSKLSKHKQPAMRPSSSAPI